MGLVKQIDLPDLSDNRGGLVAIEAERNITFSIKRVYYIFGVLDGVSRGYHAHRNLKQLIICVSGSCTIVADDGINRTSYHLDSADKGIIIENMIWREMHNFSENCVLLVLASDYYDESDYIRNYQQFLVESGN